MCGSSFVTTATASLPVAPCTAATQRKGILREIPLTFDSDVSGIDAFLDHGSSDTITVRAVGALLDIECLV